MMKSVSKSPLGAVFFPVLVAASLAAPALAQDAVKGLGFEAGASLLGAYIAPTYLLAPTVVLRAPVYFGSLSGVQTYEGNAISGKVDAESYALMADFHPRGGGLRLTTGIGFGGLSISGTATNPRFNGTTYAGTSTVTVKQTNSVTPSFSVGYSGAIRGGFGFTADLGVRITTYTMTATDGFVPAAAKAQFAADLAATNAELAKNNITPFVSLGLAYRF